MTVLSHLSIESLAHGGSAVAHAEDGRVVFVEMGCPGDVADVEIVADHGRYVEGRIADLVEASADRRTPPCPYFGVCGGCQWQHIAYGVQAEAKRSQVSDSLSRIGRIEGVTVEPTVSGPSPYGYRNRLEMRVGADVNHRPVLGLTAAGSEEIVPIDACLLLPDRARKSPHALAGALRYLSGRAEMAVDRVAVRVAAHTRDLEIDLWGPPGPFARQAVARTLGDALKPTCVTRVLVKDDPRRRADLKVEVLSGPGHWRERLGGHAFRVSAPSFFQVNTAAAELLLDLVLRTIEVDGSDRVLDLFAGVGTFTLPLAERAGEVVAIEGTGAAVRDLHANLDAAEVWADVMPGDAGRALAEAGRFDAVVVDPPRAGMTPETLRALVDTKARRICYVSCDPATLARDCRTLGDQGYRLVSATPVDLFPQTWHTETVALLVKSSS